MELIILNIGLERHLITPLLFSTMVLMAILTTMSAAPLYKLLYRAQPATTMSVPVPAVMSNTRLPPR